MSIDRSHNRISPTTFDSTKSTPKNSELETNKSSQTEIDLSGLHEAAKEFEDGINQIAQKQKQKSHSHETKSDPSKLNFFEKFLNDNWGVRIYAALGNEIAESFYDLAAHILPKPVANALYGGFWSLAIGATGARVVANANHAESKDKLKAGGKLLVHDGISAIVAPTIVARTMNFIQNKLYKPLPIPETLKHLVKSVISILTCKVAIQKLDPIAMKLSGNLFNYRNDRHSEINKVKPGDKDGVRDLSFASAA